MAAAAKKSIYELLPLVQREIGNIGKNKKNAHQGYNFRGIDDVLNAIGPALAKVGVTVTAQVVKHDREEVAHKNGYRVNVRLKMRVTFWGPDGTSLRNCTVGEAQDFNGDKATNKAMSVAFKYAAFMGLAIPLEPGVMDDSDADDKPKGGTAKKPAASKAKTTAKPSSKASGGSSKPAAKGGSDKKSPPSAFDGKPAHDKQLKEIAAGMMKITGEDDPKADANQEKLRGLLDYVNGQRPGMGIEGEASTLKDLYYVEAEKVMRVLKPQLAKLEQ